MTNLTIVSDFETIETDSETLSLVANEINENIISEIQDGLDKLESLSNLPLREQEIERKLTDEELLELGQLISDDLKKMQDLEFEKKNYDSYMSNKIKTLKDQIFENNITHQSKTKLEYVSCYYNKNFTTGKREYFSTVTGELLKTERLSSEDYQTQIDLKEQVKDDSIENNFFDLSNVEVDFETGEYKNGTTD